MAYSRGNVGGDIYRGRYSARMCPVRYFTQTSCIFHDVFKPRSLRMMEASHLIHVEESTELSRPLSRSSDRSCGRVRVINRPRAQTRLHLPIGFRSSRRFFNLGVLERNTRSIYYKARWISLLYECSLSVVPHAFVDSHYKAGAPHRDLCKVLPYGRDPSI